MKEIQILIIRNTIKWEDKDREQWKHKWKVFSNMVKFGKQNKINSNQ